MTARRSVVAALSALVRRQPSTPKPEPEPEPYVFGHYYLEPHCRPTTPPETAYVGYHELCGFNPCRCGGDAS